MRNINKDIKIQSAGLGALKYAPIAPEVKAILDRYQIDTTAHKGKQVNEELIIDADIILVMEEWQKKELTLAFPSTHGKISLLGKWNDDIIEDPYRKAQEVFEETFLLIKKNWDLWQQKLWQN